MGTHISRVKSVDLDAWTDEQLLSVLSWGNARAIKYWEAKLAAGHVPSESKIENFIRTKYELKRWVMDGPIPDPKTLDVEGDDDIPLSIVKEKQTIDRKESIRKSSVGRSAAPATIAAPQADLIGGDPIPQRASTAGPTAGPTAGKVPPKAEPAPPRASSTKDSLLGLDFLGTEPAAPPRPASTTGTSSMSGGQSRPDLKQSILSLYASAPRPQPQPQPAPHASSGSFGGSGSFAGMPSPTMSQPQNTGGGFVDAFSNLSFNSSHAPKSPQNDAFSSFGNLAAKPSPPPPQNTTSAFSGLSGGSFFDTKTSAPAPSHQQKQSLSGFGGFATPTASAPAPKPAPAPSSSSDLDNLFDYSAPAQPAAQPTSPPAPQQQQPPAAAAHSVFNLSASQPKPAPAAAPASNPVGAMSSNLSGAAVWGSSPWGAPGPPPAAAPSASARPPGLSKTSSLGMTNEFGWGSSSGGSHA